MDTSLAPAPPTGQYAEAPIYSVEVWWSWAARQTYCFATKAERDAFMSGIAKAYASMRRFEPMMRITNE